jgi:hypothetical protein
MDQKALLRQLFRRIDRRFVITTKTVGKVNVCCQWCMQKRPNLVDCKNGAVKWMFECRAWNKFKKEAMVGIR